MLESDMGVSTVSYWKHYYWRWVERRETGEDVRLGRRLTMFYVFWFYYLSFILFLGGGGRVQAPGERGGWCSGQLEKERNHFFIARCPSYTKCTTSTRPVFDNLYCWTACDLILTRLKENPTLLCLFNILNGGRLKPCVSQLSSVSLWNAQA